MTSLDKQVVIIAGEESGDMHAASFVKVLKERHPKLRISGIGGKHMEQAGVELVSDLAKYGVTGVTEVLKYAFVIRKAFKIIKKHLTDIKPDLLILVDYPGFNLRLAKFAKKALGLRILYYISPQIWAWKASRIQTIRACVDHMAVIFPFEKKLYEKAEVPVSFVGHPLTEKIKPSGQPDLIRAKLALPLDKCIIALLPGSRQNEIARHMPVMRDAMRILYKKYPHLHIAIPVAASIDPVSIRDFFQDFSGNISIIQGQAREVMDCSDLVAVASGTASLECALYTKPMCIVYKASRITAICAAQLMRVQYLGLCNLLANRMIVPELLQDDCNAENLAQCLSDMLSDKTVSKKMVDRLVALKNKLSLDEADCTISELIEAELQGLPL